MKYILENMVVRDLNVKCLIQVRNNNENVGQAVIKKCLKTMYHVVYKSNTYSIKKSLLKYNIH